MYDSEARVEDIAMCIIERGTKYRQADRPLFTMDGSTSLTQKWVRTKNIKYISIDHTIFISMTEEEMPSIHSSHGLFECLDNIPRPVIVLLAPI